MKRVWMTVLFVLLAVTVSACSSQATISLISPDDYVSQYTETGTEHILIDVRTPEEFNSGHIAGAVNIPVEVIASRLAEIPSNIPVVVYCRSGNRSATAATILSENDYSEIYDLGGIISWTAAGYPIQ